MYWVVLTVALGGVLARDGESCVSTTPGCWDTNSCARSVKVRIAHLSSSFLGSHLNFERWELLVVMAPSPANVEVSIIPPKTWESYLLKSVKLTT